MREIKSKAWDINKKRWIEPSIYYENGFCYIDTSNRKVIPVLYTGLKDKSGKEIYEGDIVKDETSSGKRLFEIYWDNETASFWAKLISTEDKQYRVGHNFAPEIELEIIGNIYENPELCAKLD